MPAQQFYYVQLLIQSKKCINDYHGMNPLAPLRFTVFSFSVPQCNDRTERDRLLVFVDKLLYHKVRM